MGQEIHELSDSFRNLCYQEQIKNNKIINEAYHFTMQRMQAISDSLYETIYPNENSYQNNARFKWVETQNTALMNSIINKAERYLLNELLNRLYITTCFVSDISIIKREQKIYEIESRSVQTNHNIEVVVDKVYDYTKKKEISLKPYVLKNNTLGRLKFDSFQDGMYEILGKVILTKGSDSILEIPFNERIIVKDN